MTRPNTFTSNYDAYGNTQYNRDNWDFKVNYNPTDKLMVWGRYSLSPMDIVALLVLGPVAGGDAFGGGNPGHAGGRVQTTAAGFTYTISPTVLVDGNVGYTRQNIGANGDEQNGDYGTDVLKIPGTNGMGPNYMGVPGFQVTGVANMGNTNTGSPFLFRDNQYTTAINLSKTKGAHNLRFGFEYDKYALNHFQPQGGTFGTARGTFGFDGTLTALKGGAAVNFNGVPANSWAQFLLGDPSRVGKITQFQNPNSLRFSDWAFYARDQWQVTRNLTINYGLRWEYYPIFSHNWYGATRFDTGTLTELIGGEGSVPWDTGATASKKGFAPRLGLAYRLGPKTVIRTGYGITIDPDNMRNQRNAFPSVLNQDFQPANSYQFVTNTGVPIATLRTGIPAPTAPDISGGKITASTVASPTTYLPSTSIAASFPQYMNRGYIQSWNFFLQREFSPTLTAEAGYVGTHAVHQMMAVNINGSAPNTGNAGRQFAPYLTTDLNQYQPFGDLTYNALQTNVKKRFGSSIVGSSLHVLQGHRQLQWRQRRRHHIPRLPGVVCPEQAVGRLRPQTHVPALSRLPVAVRQRAQASQPRRGGVDRRRIPDRRHPQPVQRPAIHPRLRQLDQCRRPGADGVADQSGSPDPGRPRSQYPVFRRHRLHQPGRGNPRHHRQGPASRPGLLQHRREHLAHLHFQKREDQVAVRRRGLQSDQYGVVLHSERHLCGTHVEHRWLRQELRQLQRDQQHRILRAPVAGGRVPAVLTTLRGTTGD